MNPNEVESKSPLTFLVDLDKDTQTEIITRTTASQDKAIQFDIEIAEDGLRYSTWIIALATAGFGIILLNGDKFGPLWLTKKELAWALTSSTILFLISSFVGASYYYYSNLFFRLERQNRTLLLKQEMYLLNLVRSRAEFENEEENQDPFNMQIEKILRPLEPGLLVDSILKGKFFSHMGKDEEDQFKTLSDNIISVHKRLKRLLWAQQGLTCLGYLLILACAVPFVRQ